MSFEQYQHGALAAQLLREKSPYTANALEVLAGERGLNLGEEAEGFVKGTYASQKGIETATKIYSDKFDEERGTYTPGEAARWYDPVLEGLEPEERASIVGILESKDETIADITKKVGDAAYVLQSPEGMFTEDKLSEARSTIEKYQGVMKVMGDLDQYSIENLRPEATNEARLQNLKGLAAEITAGENAFARPQYRVAA